MRWVTQTGRRFQGDRAVRPRRGDGRRVSGHGSVLNQGPAIGLMSSDDDENVAVDEDHQDERGEKEAGVLAAEAQLADEIRFASLGLLSKMVPSIF